jgi:hypothetical protein
VTRAPALRARVVVSVGTGLLALLVSSRAHAEDLRDVAGRVEGAWRAAGGLVSRGGARFVMEDESTTVDVRASRDPKGEGDTSCVRVAFIGARGMSFHVTPLVTSAGTADDDPPVASVAGVVELHGCGVVPDLVRLRSDSGRGALEVVVASGQSTLPPASAVLLERTGGVLPAAPDPGALPPLPSPGARAAVAEARLVADGFRLLPQLTLDAGDDGKGGTDLTLGEGCHQLELFAPEPRPASPHTIPRRSRLDLDGALRRPEGDVIVDDQSIAPDVRLESCFAVATRVRVTFEGAPHGGPVLVSHAVHVLPQHLPATWTPEVRARVAASLLGHHAASPRDDAVLLARGASGNTPVPLDVEPGACYVAVAAMDHKAGRGHGVALRATVGGRVTQDDQGARDTAAVVAFCAADATTARVEVDARSAASGWSLAVFRMLGGAWTETP